MAIKRLIVKSEDRKNLPFLNEYLSKLSKKDLETALKSSFFVEKLLPVKSGKGSILSTKEFSIFVWRGSKEERFIFESLIQDEKFTALFIFPISKDGAFEVGFDDEIEVSATELPNNGFSFLQITF